MFSFKLVECFGGANVKPLNRIIVLLKIDSIKAEVIFNQFYRSKNQFSQQDSPLNNFETDPIQEDHSFHKHRVGRKPRIKFFKNSFNVKIL